jgi:hypothetical protein
MLQTKLVMNKHVPNQSRDKAENISINYKTEEREIDSSNSQELKSYF